MKFIVRFSIIKKSKKHIKYVFNYIMQMIIQVIKIDTIKLNTTT